MLYIKNVFLQLRLRLVRSVILAIFLLVTAVPLIIGAYMKTTVQIYFDRIAEQAGNSIYVWKTGGQEDTAFDPALLTDLLACDHVIGYNQSYACACIPISFSNSGYENETIYSAEPQTEEVKLIGNHDTSLYESFRTGTMRLIQGTYPTQQTPGILIDQYLADQNHLSVGDKLSFWNENQDQKMTATICGIYETVQPPKIDYGEYYAISAASYLFCDWETTFQQAAAYYDVAAPVTIYIDKYENMDDVFQSFEGILSAYSTADIQYRCVDMVKSDSSLEAGTGGFIEFRKLLNIVLGALQIILLLLDGFMVLLWVQDHHQDVGIYLVLGWSKCRILATLLCEGILIFLVASIPAILTGTLLLKQLGSTIFLAFSSFMHGQAQSEAKLNDAIQSAINMKTVLGSVGWQGVLYVFVILLSGFHTLHLRCTTLLSDKKAI